MVYCSKRVSNMWSPLTQICDFYNVYITDQLFKCKILIDFHTDYGHVVCLLFVSCFILIYSPFAPLASCLSAPPWLASPVPRHPPPLLCTCVCSIHSLFVFVACVKLTTPRLGVSSHWFWLFVFPDFDRLLDFCFSSAPRWICLPVSVFDLCLPLLPASFCTFRFF